MKYFLNLLLIFSFLSLTAQDSPLWTHKIQTKDQLHTIAQYYGVSVQSLKAVNELSSNKLDGLASLKIPLSVQHNFYKRFAENYVLHEIKEGDQLHKVAEKYKTSIELVRKINAPHLSGADIGDYMLVPNTIPLHPAINKLTISAFLSFGFFSGTNWSGERSTNYNLRASINLQNIYKKNHFQIRTRFNSMLGYRHEIGDHLLKNLDRFELRNQFLYYIKPSFSPYISGAFRTQYLPTYLPLENGGKRLISDFMAPGISKASIGFLMSNDVLDVNFGLYELKTLYVLEEKMYEERAIVFGVPKGDRKAHLHGMSLNADLNVYENQKLNYQASLFAFANLDIFSIEFRGEANYRLTKQIKLSFIGEVFYDKFIEADLQYRTELLLSVGFHKS